MLKQVMKNTRISLIILVIVYLTTRLVTLDRLPLFTDETIYIYWAKFILENKSNWFISLTDGKPPLLIWAISIMLSILPESLYVLAGRMPSVIAGVIGLFGIQKLASELFDERIGLASTVLYVFMPFLLVYDRLALFDALVGAMIVWCIYFSYRAGKTGLWKYVLCWAVFLGLSLLSKGTAVMIVFLSPLSYIAGVYETSKTLDTRKLFTYGSQILSAIVGAELIFNMLRVSSVFHLMDAKNQQFQRTLIEIMTNPFSNVLPQLQTLIIWFTQYATLPVIALVFVSLFIVKPRDRHKILLLMMLCIAPLIGFSVVAKIIFPRYIVFVSYYLIILAAYTVSKILERTNIRQAMKAGLIAVLVIWFVYIDWFVLFDMPHAPLPKIDHEQLVQKHMSGYGYAELFETIDSLILKEGELVVVTEGTFGILPYLLELEYWDSESVYIEPRWPIDEIPRDVQEKYSDSQIYVLFKERSRETIPEELVVVEEYQKPSENGDPLLFTVFADF